MRLCLSHRDEIISIADTSYSVLSMPNNCTYFVRLFLRTEQFQRKLFIYRMHVFCASKEITLHLLYLQTARRRRFNGVFFPPSICSLSRSVVNCFNLLFR